MILHHTLLLNTWYLLQVNRHRDLHIHHIIRGVVESQYITKCIFYVANYHVELFFLYQIVTDDVCSTPTINRHKVTGGLMYGTNNKKRKGPSCPWTYGSWIYSYLCNQSLSPLMLWVRISNRARCTTLCDKVCQWLDRSVIFSGSSGFLHQ